MQFSIPRIALRNLFRQRRRTLLLGGAIAFGIFIVTMINGFAGSFVENVSENFSNLLAGHIFIDGVEKAEGSDEVSVIRDDDTIMEAIEAAGIEALNLTRRSSFRGTLIFQGESLSQQIVGTDFSEEAYLTERLILLDGSFENMRTNRQGLIISEDIAEKLNVEVNDRLIVRLETVRGQQNVGDFSVAGISYDPNLFGPLAAYANLSYVNELLTLAPGEYQTFGLFLPSIAEIDPAADQLYESLSERVDTFPRNTEDEGQNPVEALFEQADEQQWEGVRYRLYTLNEVLAEVQQIVTILNQASLIILLVLFFIIMVGITNTFRMIMYERIKEIGTVRALGMHRWGVIRLFLYEALFLAVLGAAAGLLFAGVAMFVVSQIYLGLDSPIFILLRNGYLTFKVLPLQTLLHVGIVASLTIAAAFVPTRRAAYLPPVDALRSHG
jgi:putative ABC transport system permease protein